jgi:hypothetical protein
MQSRLPKKPLDGDGSRTLNSLLKEESDEAVRSIVNSYGYPI